MDKMIKKPIFWFIGLLIVAGAVLAAINLSGRQTNDNDVTVAQFGDLLLYLPLYIAVDGGEFDRQGLSVELISTGGDDKTFAAVLSGDAQFGVADPTFTAIAGERGAKGSVVGLLVNGMPNYGVSTDPDAPTISDLKQLEGKRFASVPAPSTAYAALADLYRKGEAKADILQTSPAGLFAAADQPDVFGVVLIEPWASQIELNGGKVVLSMDSFFGEFALTGITTLDEFRKTNPQAVKKFRDAMRSSIDVFYNDPEKALEIALKRFPKEDPASVERGIERMRSDGIYPKDLRVTKNSWDAAINLRKESGDLESISDDGWAYVALEAR